jgi:hypothetical protein
MGARQTRSIRLRVKLASLGARRRGRVQLALTERAADGRTATTLIQTRLLANVREHAPRQALARVWYVQAAAPAGGNGSERAPFNQLADAERASRAGQAIIVLPSPASVPPLGGGIALKPRQTLLGAGPAVTDGAALASLPRIANTDPGRQAGDAVELSSGDTVANLVIGPTDRGGIYGSDVTNVTVRGNDLSATNSSCTTGFVVQPCNLPTLVPGVSVPFSSGLANGWAAIMFDESHTTATVRVEGNYVHDGTCADGIDVRAAGTAHVTADIVDNRITRLQEALKQQSVLAIGMQTTGTGTLDAWLNGNSETYIGNAIIGDLGIAERRRRRHPRSPQPLRRRDAQLRRRPRPGGALRLPRGPGVPPGRARRRR